LTDHKGGLAKKLAEVTAALGWVEKRGTNSAQGYKYAQAVDIFDAVRTELSARNISFGLSQDDINVHYPDGGGQHITVKGSYTFTDGDTGEVEMGHWTGFDVDKAGKALWKALTGATKYIFITKFLLPTGDDPENDSADKPERKPAEQASTGPKPPAAEKAEKADKVGLTNAQKGKLAVVLREKGIESNDQRHLFLMTAVGKHSTSQMTSADLDKALAEAARDGSEAVSNALAVV